MSRRTRLLPALLVLLAGGAALAASRDVDPKRFPRVARVLLLPEEAALLKELRDDRDRLEFQKIFWARRDPTPGTPGYGSYNFCQGQCSYDMVVSSPPGKPDEVFLSGSMNYDELVVFGGPGSVTVVEPAFRTVAASRASTEVAWTRQVPGGTFSRRKPPSGPLRAAGVGHRAGYMGDRRRPVVGRNR